MQKRDCGRTIAVLVVSLLFLTSINLFSAIPDVLKESFDYPEGDLLGQGSAGNGWMGPWENQTDGSVFVITGSLNYEGVPQLGGYLEVSEAGTIWRHLEETWPDDGSTYWISLLYQRFDSHDVDESYNGFSLFNGASTELLYVGKPWATKVIGMDAHRASGPVRTDANAYDLNWIVVKLIMDGTAANDKAYLWINPDPAVEPDTSAADTSAYWEGSNGFDRIRIGSGNDPSPAEVIYDEITLSRTYAGLTSDPPPSGVLPSPVSFFDFEEEEGAEVIDQGSAGNNGEIIGAWIDRVPSGGIVTAEGETGKCIEFVEEDGFGELTYVSVPYQEYMNSENYTLSTWILYTGTANWGYLFWADGYVWEPELQDRHIDVWLHPYGEELGVDCILNTQDDSTLRVANDPAESGLNLADGFWHQVTVVLKDNIEYYIYIDGEWVADDAGEASDFIVENMGDDMWLGARPNNADATTAVKLVGLMDRVRIWDQALTEEQVQYLFDMEGPDGGTVGVKEEKAVPVEFALKANYPNPFNPTTTISYTLDKTGQVTLDVYDLLGHKVKTLAAGVQAPGEHVVQWDATNDLGQSVSSGVYLYRLNTGNRVETRKMMLLK